MLRLSYTTKKISHILAAVALILANLSCGTATFKATSEPEAAEIFLVPQDGKEKKSLGKTPLELPVPDLELQVSSMLQGESLVKISIEKQGYAPEVMYLPAPRVMSQSTELFVKLQESKNAQHEMTVQKILDHIFLAQKLALTEQFERAHIEIDKVIVEFPKFARALSMRASIFYAQQNFAEAAKWYEAAITADPQLDEAVRLLAKAKQRLRGDREPASGNGP